MKGMSELIIVLIITFGILLTPLFFIGFDFWAGNRKARQRGEPILSDKWQRTVAKISRYYNMLLALTVLDCMQMACIWFLDNYYGYHLPMFPVITLFGAFAVGAIEVKSIFEKAEDKAKKDVSDVAVLVSEIMKSKTDPAEIAKAVVSYMNKPDGQ